MKPASEKAASHYLPYLLALRNLLSCSSWLRLCPCEHRISLLRLIRLTSELSIVAIWWLSYPLYIRSIISSSVMLIWLAMVNQNNVKLSHRKNIFHRLSCNAKGVTIKERWRCILWEKQQH